MEPTPKTLRAIARAIAAMVSAAHGAIVIGGLMGSVGAIAGAFSTGLLTWLVVRAARSKGGELSLGRLLGASVFAGCLNAPLSWALICVLDEVTCRQYANLLGAITLVGGALGGCLGLAFGVALATLIPLERMLARPRSQCAWAHAFGPMGAWVAFWGSTLFVWPGCVPPRPAISLEVAEHAALVMVIAGLLLAGASAARILPRALWLARVRKGLIAGWSIVDRSELEASEHLLPFSPDSTTAKVLVRDEPLRADGAYREGRSRRPYAYAGQRG